MRILAGCLIAISAAAAHAADAPFDVVSLGAARIAVPKGWRAMEALTGKLLVRQGDGIGIIPAVDDTGAPLQIGLIVDKSESVTKQSLDEVVNEIIAGASNDPRLELTGKEVTALKLTDGTEARLLKAEFLKKPDRRSVQMKLVMKDAASNIWVVHAHLVGGKDSEWARSGSTMAKWLETHLTSFTLDGSKFDRKRVEAAYVAGE